MGSTDNRPSVEHASISGPSHPSKLYQTLPPDTIRLLSVLPGPLPSPIHTTLSSHSISDLPAYEALSYTWDTPDPNNPNSRSPSPPLKDIKCNDITIPVRPNLFAALRRFRDSSKSQLLWVDAICINQSDTEERTQQVGLMRQIYRKAENVFIWLGEEMDDVAGQENQVRFLDVGYTFRVANRRVNYQSIAHVIEAGKGTRPIVLVSDDAEGLEMLGTMQKKMMYQQQDLLTKGQKVLDTVSTWDSRAKLFLGFKEFRSEGREPDEPALLECALSPARIKGAMEQQLERSLFDTFDDFVKQAIAPPEFFLSEEKKTVVYYTLVDLFSRSYFQRRWILQEIILSRRATIACGEHKIDLFNFASVYSLYPVEGFEEWSAHFLSNDLAGGGERDLVYQAPPRQQTTRQIIENWGTLTLLFKDRKELLVGRPRMRTLGTYLTMYSQQVATDIHDNIFSLIGIVQEACELDVELQFCKDLVDYRIDFGELCIKVATHWLTAIDRYHESKPETSLTLTHLMDSFSVRIVEQGGNKWDLPSWVPDWSQTMGRDTSFSSGVSQSPMRSFVGRARVDGRSLFMPGLILGKVASATEKLPKAYSTLDAADLYQNFIEGFAGTNRNVYGTKEGFFAAFWRTIVCDRFGSGTAFLMGRQKGDAAFEKEVDSWVKNCRNGYERFVTRQEVKTSNTGNSTDGKKKWWKKTFSKSAKSSPSSNVGLTKGMEKYNNDESEWVFPDIRSGVSQHCFMVTEKGYFGLASPTVEPNDCVAFLAGSSVISFLRPCEGGYYRLVGAGWVHGFMYDSDKFWDESQGRELIYIEMR